MAAEAVKKVREAEEQGRELIRAASEQAKQAAADALRDGQERKRQIMAEASQAREARIAAAVRKAEENCRELVSKGEAERAAILEPGNLRLERAVQLIVERTVTVNGNC